MAIGDKIKAVLGGSKSAPANAPKPFEPDPDFRREDHPEAALAANRSKIIKDWIQPNGVGAEIGVFWAHFTPHLLAVAQPSKLYMVDPWELTFGETYAKSGIVDANRGRLTTAETHAAAHEIVATHPRVVSLHKSDPVTFLADLPDQTLDWAYIDYQTSYSSTRLLLQALLPKMTPSGVIMGDDYIWDRSNRRYDIKMAVDEFATKYGLEFIEQPHYQFVLLQGQSPRPS